MHFDVIKKDIYDKIIFHVICTNLSRWLKISFYLLNFLQLSNVNFLLNRLWQLCLSTIYIEQTLFWSNQTSVKARCDLFHVCAYKRRINLENLRQVFHHTFQVKFAAKFFQGILKNSQLINLKTSWQERNESVK